MPPPDSIGPGTKLRQFVTADWASDLDLVATFGQPVRKIRCVDAGVLVIETSGDSTARSLDVTADWQEIAQFTKIKAGTTVTKIQVLV